MLGGSSTVDAVLCARWWGRCLQVAAMCGTYNWLCYIYWVGALAVLCVVLNLARRVIAVCCMLSHCSTG
jgi:hypothetical protein